MTQERTAGALLVMIGMFLLIKPKATWKMTEQWKNNDVTSPSSRYITTVRIVGGVACIPGVLLSAGVIG